jgi:hypothetical protein
MLLCATATESNKEREIGANNPTLQRAASITNGSEILPPGKDLYEGFGMINPDAAVEAVSLTCTNGTTESATFGDAPRDRRAWARTVNLIGGQLFAAELTVPPNGDFDLYLYSSQPSSTGTPVILASSAQSSYGGVETLSYAPETNRSAVLVVKRVFGFGTFNFTGTEIPAPLLVVGPPDPVNFVFSFSSISGRTYEVQYKDFVDDPNWQLLQTVSGDGTTKVIIDPLSPTQRFYRLAMR